MKTIGTAAIAYSACTAARWYLERSSRREREQWKGRILWKGLWNRGAAFSLPIPEKALLPGSALALGLLWLERRRSPIGAGLILGGGLSNLHERVQGGKVYDYIQFPKAPEPLRRYVFNLADLAILSGGALMLGCWGRKKWKP